MVEGEEEEKDRDRQHKIRQKKKLGEREREKKITWPAAVLSLDTFCQLFQPAGAEGGKKKKF